MTNWRLYKSDASPEFRYNLLFGLFGKKVRPLLDSLEIHLDYYDPDTSYEEDMEALMNALWGVRQDVERVLKSYEENQD